MGDKSSKRLARGVDDLGMSVCLSAYVCMLVCVHTYGGVDDLGLSVCVSVCVCIRMYGGVDDLGMYVCLSMRMCVCIYTYVWGCG